MTSATSQTTLPISFPVRFVALARRGAERPPRVRGPDGSGGSSTSGAAELVNDAREQPPEALDGRDADAFVGGVRRLDLRAERNHV
jgi:hypothetical protein